MQTAGRSVLKERLDKILAGAGISSRSDVKKLIRAGRVTVNGAAAQSPDMKIERGASTVRIDGAAVNTARYRYFMMNKPSGLLSATEDRKQRTVLDILEGYERNMGLFPVGRLDKDTEGLLLLTNDGEFSHRVISPASGISKVYYARVDGVPDEEDAEAFSRGLVLADGTQCLPAVLEPTGSSACFVTVYEGKYHQVKRMLAAVGKPVLSLKRLSIGGLKLPDDLESGRYRELSEDELCKIFNGN
ncbi:MAG: rRNA pseudouridine synthase [Oscillospiraceae bacterium]|nr:rRNA pseudouridine synthase [Oscillospiraceae bacterium]